MSLSLEEYQGLILRRLRLSRKLRLHEVELATGIGRATISRIELGQLSLRNRFEVERKLEKYYGLPYGLLAFDDTFKAQPTLFKAEEPATEERPVKASLPAVKVEKSEDVLEMMSRFADMLFKAYEAGK